MSLQVIRVCSVVVNCVELCAPSPCIRTPEKYRPVNTVGHVLNELDLALMIHSGKQNLLVLCHTVGQGSPFLSHKLVNSWHDLELYIVLLAAFMLLAWVG